MTNTATMKQHNTAEYVKILAREFGGEGSCYVAEIVDEEQRWHLDDMVVELKMQHPIRGKSFFRFYVTPNGRPYAYKGTKKFYLYHGGWKDNAFRNCLIWK